MRFRERALVGEPTSTLIGPLRPAAVAGLSAALLTRRALRVIGVAVGIVVRRLLDRVLRLPANGRRGMVSGTGGRLERLHLQIIETEAGFVHGLLPQVIGLGCSARWGGRRCCGDCSPV